MDNRLTRASGPDPLVLAVAGVVGAVLLACLISPPIYWVARSFEGMGVLGSLAGFPFHRFFSRILQICTICALVPVAVYAGVFSRKSLQLFEGRGAVRDVVSGLVMALLPVAVLAAAYLSLEIYKPRKDLPWEGLVRIFFTAGGVSLVEEFLFRGILLGLAIRAFGTLPGAAALTVLFAGVHFLRPAKLEVSEVTWTSGFQQAAAVFSNLPEPILLGFGFASLLLAGGILAWAVVKTGTLWLAVGLHAGWILAQQGLNWYAKFQAKPSGEFLPWIGANVVSGVVPTGVAPLFVLGITGFLVHAYLRHGRRFHRQERP